MSISSSLNYSQQGEGDPIILFHGLGGNGQQWESLVPEELPYKLFLPDLPGHGKTNWLPSAPCSFENFAGAVLEWVAQLEAENGKFDRLILGGISMGAGIAVRIAQAIPDRISKLILVRPAWLDNPFRQIYIYCNLLVSTCSCMIRNLQKHCSCAIPDF